MVCYLTSKRITYFLIIRQLRFDRYDFVASELKRLFFNSLGNLDLFNLPPSDELQRIIGSNSICTELLSSAQSSLDILTKTAAPNENLLRRPKSNLSINENAYFVVSQDDVSSPVTLLVDPNTEIGTVLAGSSSTIQPTEESSVTQVLKRGRTVHSSSSSSSAQEHVTSDTPQTGESELKKISQELRNEDKVSQEQSINSFLSIKGDTVESPQCDGVLKTFSTVVLNDAHDDLESMPSDHIDFITSQTQPSELPEHYTKCKIVKITNDADESMSTRNQPDPPSDHIKSRKTDPSLTNDLCLSDQHTDEFQKPTWPRYYKFSDYGRPEDFANCPKRTEKDLQHKQETKVSDPKRASASEFDKPIQGDSIDSCSSKNTPPNFRNDNPDKVNVNGDRKVIVLDYINKSIDVGDNPDLHSLGHDDKITVLKILAEGWKRKRTFEKRVTAKIPCAQKSVLGEILYAVFGDRICTYVRFRITKNDRLQVMLKPTYKDEHFGTILSMV